MANEQSLNLKTEQFVLIKPENTCYFLEPSLEHPYMKIFFFLECP
jgi:hypothetical protein